VNHRTSGRKFLPSEEWLGAWRSQLPLAPSLQFIKAMMPPLQLILQGSASDESQLLECIKKANLVGLLPLPHPIIIRKYQTNISTDLWFSVYMWGVIFKRNENPPLFLASKIRLFTIAFMDHNSSSVSKRDETIVSSNQ